MCRLSVVTSWSCRATHRLPAYGPPRAGPRARWVSCLDPRGCHRVQDDLLTKSQPLCVLVGVVTSCVLCARVRGRVSRSCATENTHTLLDWKRCSSSQSSPFSSICIVRSNISAGVQLVRHVFSCCRQCRNPPCLRKRKSVSFSED